MPRKSSKARGDNGDPGPRRRRGEAPGRGAGAYRPPQVRDGLRRPRRALPRNLYVLSDSTGNLPRHMVSAFLTQFPDGTFDVRVKTFLDTPQKLDAAFDEIRSDPGIVMHALVDPAMKRRATEQCVGAGVSACDLTGAFVEFLAHASGATPTPDVRRLHGVDKAYRRRVKAVEFALEHDDGLGLDTLHRADVVLAGVSRTSKTPTCMYLAQQGYKAGNVSLAMNIDPPAELLALPKSKVAALIIDPRQLAEIRSRRQTAWHMPDTTYNSTGSVEAEVAWSRRLFTRLGWSMFDVTDQAIEETAGRIVDRLNLAQMSGPAAGDDAAAGSDL